MSESPQKDDKPVPRAFLEELGFELPEEVLGFYTEGSDIIFNLQIVEEVGCDFRVHEEEEKFPLNEEQIRKLKDAGYYGSDGFLIL